MNRKFKFRRAHYRKGSFFKFTYWGFIDDSFVGPSHIGGCDSHVDEQFTGLHDKNGKEIYDNHKVSCHFFYEALGEELGVYETEKVIDGVISFQELGLWIECDSEQDSCYLSWINGLHEESFEITGNIHEND